METSPKAHTKEGAPPEEWEDLFTPFGEVDPVDPSLACSGRDGALCVHCEELSPQHGHLNKVAWWTAKFAGSMFSSGKDRRCGERWGYVAGLWHDLGKFSEEFQSYLAKAGDVHGGEVREKTDHTSAGAKLAASKPPLGSLIATAIAGHHSGLLDARSESACLLRRLTKSIPACSSAPEEIVGLDCPPPPSFITATSHAFSVAFFQRMIFSCLVDADFLATEAFMNPGQSALRPRDSSGVFVEARRLLEEKIASFGSPNSPVNRARATVLSDCIARAEDTPGLFSLTVPTGGGKTLASLAFGLTHAIRHGHRRIIYVIPFTSIIEQNAGVFADLLESLGADVVLEHHSNLAPEKETTQSRLATENWDAPIIVTTAVQFYESLFAAKTSRSRRIHNIANSVVILDEAQALPVQYLDPCLRTLEQLYTNYHTTTVLCTATQPAIVKNRLFPIGLDNPTEITSDTNQLFVDLDRVTISYRGTLDDQVIAAELAAVHQALCIVNTRNHAQALFRLLPPSEENYHLSALMCPEHRLQILRVVRERLDQSLPVRLISTQLIEAGVDIDFPIVYRSMAGLDSIAQAAGRCNRNGILESGAVHVFHSEHTASERYFRETATVGHEILDLHADDPLSTSAVQAYFEKYYYQQKTQWDSKAILEEFKIAPQEKTIPLLFQYRTVAEKFKLIENNQISIIIPWDQVAKDLIDQQLRNETIPLHRKLFRALQRYTVQIYDNQFRENIHQFEQIRDGQFNVLICPETHYSDQFGLNLSDDDAATTLIC